MQEAVTIFSRLSEVEKIALRAATPDGIAHLAHNSYTVDMVRLNVPVVERIDVLEEVQAICKLRFSVRSAENTF